MGNRSVTYWYWWRIDPRSARRDATGPRDDQRHADSAGVGGRLVEPERGVRRHPPPTGVVDEGLGPADQVGIARHVQVPARHGPEPTELLEVAARTVRSTLFGRPVVRREDHHGVLGVAQLLDGLQQPGQVLIDVVDHRRVDLHVTREQRPLVVGVIEPGPHLVAGLVVPGRHRRAGREDPLLDLAGEAPLAELVPAHVVPAAVPSEIRRLGVQRAVHGAMGEVEEEGSVGIVSAKRLEIADRLVGDVVGEVVAVGVGVDVDGRVVPDQVVRLMQVRPPFEHAVEAFEPALERPGPPRCPGMHDGVPGEVPLAHGVGRVAGGEQPLGQRLDGGADLHGPTGKARIEVRHAGEAGPMRVEAGLDGRPRRRAERRGVVVREPHAARGQPIQRGRGDLRPERTDVAEAHVVEQDQHHVGAARGRPCGLRPPRRRFGHRAAHRAEEARLTTRHGRNPPIVWTPTLGARAHRIAEPVPLDGTGPTGQTADARARPCDLRRPRAQGPGPNSTTGAGSGRSRSPGPWS